MKIWPRTAEEFVRTLAYDAGRVVAAAACEHGMRRPVGWLADLFWLGMADELERHGVSQRVASDMFGVSRRTYQRQLASTREYVATAGLTLWNSIHVFVSNTPSSRDEVIARYPSLEPRRVGAILHDMVSGGWLREQDGLFHAVERDDELTDDTIESVVLSEFFLRGEVDAAALAADLGVPVDRVEPHVERLPEREEPIDEVTNAARWPFLTVLAMQSLEFLRAAAFDGDRDAHRSILWTLGKVGPFEEAIEGYNDAVDELLAETGQISEDYFDRAPPAAREAAQPTEEVYAWSVTRTLSTLATFTERMAARRREEAE